MAGRLLSLSGGALALLVAALAFAFAAGTVDATAARAPGCSIPNHGEHLGPTYLTQLSVSGTTCVTGLKVVAAYHACQVQHGGVKSICSAPVDGFRCREKRGPSIPTEFYSTVSCRDHSARVDYKYAQFS